MRETPELQMLTHWLTFLVEPREQQVMRQVVLEEVEDSLTCLAVLVVMRAVMRVLMLALTRTVLPLR